MRVDLRSPRTLGFLLLGTAAMTSSSCASSFLVSNRVNNNGPVEGVIYYLPMRVMALTATRKGVSVTSLDAILTQLRSELDDATAAATAAKEVADQEKALLDALPATTSEAARTSQRVKYEIALANQSLLEAAQRRVAARLAGTAQLRQAALARGDALACEYSVKLEPLPMLPDTRQVYVASIDHSVWRDDQAQLTVGTNGLLSNSSGQSTDQSLEIIETIAGAAAAITTRPSRTFMQSLPPESPTTPLRPTPCVEGEQTVSGIFEFTPGSERSSNELLQSADIPFTIRFKLLGEAVEETAGDGDDKRKECNDCGLFYRVNVPVRVTVARLYVKGGNDVPTEPVAVPPKPMVVPPEPVDVQSMIVSVPQLGPIGLIPYRSGFGVRTSTTATFTDGVLTSWTETRPSEMLAVANAPLAVASAIVRVPTELVQLRVDYSSANRNLANAEIAEAAALANRASLRRCLIAAAGDPTAVDACLDE